MMQKAVPRHDAARRACVIQAPGKKEVCVPLCAATLARRSYALRQPTARGAGTGFAWWRMEADPGSVPSTQFLYWSLHP